jgi:hypothetical protein
VAESKEIEHLRRVAREHITECFDQFGQRRKTYEEGAAVAFGLMGMAEAIRINGPRVVHRTYYASEIDGQRVYDVWCQGGCGVLLDGRAAGVHEGTDLEYCGACRFSQ